VFLCIGDERVLFQMSAVTVLVFHYIERGAGDVFARECFEECFFVVELSARGVDVERTSLHLFEMFFFKQICICESI